MGFIVDKPSVLAKVAKVKGPGRGGFPLRYVVKEEKGERL